MSRKNFIILNIIESILWIGAMVIGSMLDSKLWVTISMLIILISLLHAAYVTIVKKSINLLAGMTEEQAVEIQRDPEKLKKYERITQVIGVTILVSSLFLIYLIYKYNVMNKWDKLTVLKKSTKNIYDLKMVFETYSISIYNISVVYY